MDGGSYHCIGGDDQSHPQEKEMQEGKWLSEEALQILEKVREAKGERQRGKCTQLKAELQRTARREEKAFVKWTMQRNRGKQ